MAGYSEEERQKHDEYLLKHPNCNVWTTETGHRIPFNLLNDDHLKNVIRHLKNRIKAFKQINPVNANYAIKRTQETINQLELMQKKRLMKKSPAGKILYAD